MKIFFDKFAGVSDGRQVLLLLLFWGCGLMRHDEKTSLTFYDGKFRLNKEPPRNAYWQIDNDGTWATTDFGAARAFRNLADEKTENIFKRLFQAHYDFPSLASFPKFWHLLDPHQREGVKWILTRKRSYLAHCAGAGKTAEAIIAASLAGGLGQILFIVPPSLTLNWEREVIRFTEWTGSFSEVSIVPRSDCQSEMNWNAAIIICPDSMLAKGWVYAEIARRRFKFIAVDEASRFKEPFSERSLAFYGGACGEKRFPGIFRDARHVVFLDGSPMPNRPIELWTPAYALHPEAIDCRDYDDFGYRYCGAKPNERGVWEYRFSSHEAELREKLQKDFMHVVTESELSHPERRRSMLIMNEDVRSLEQKTWEKKHLSANTLFSKGEIARFRRELGLRKVPWIARYVRERLEEKNESILLYCWHREVARTLEKALTDFTPLTVIGSTPIKLREEVFSLFQNGESRLIIGNILAMGRGHNLQKADRVIFGEFSWTDEVNKQAEKRASRRGSEKDFVRCEYIVCPDSMDELVLRSVFTKERRVREVVG